LWACGDDKPPPPAANQAAAVGSGGAGQGGGGGNGAGGGSGAENCTDGSDNDGDGDIDCEDADCATACQSPCEGVVPLADPALVVNGDTSGHGNDGAASCGGGGGQIIYQVTTAQAGFYDVRLISSSGNHSVSIRESCADAGTELGCQNRVAPPDALEILTLPVTQGQTFFVVVDSDGSDGAYLISQAMSRVSECGDAITDPGEECDDGMSEGGGCDDNCLIDATESEPNNTFGTADPHSEPFYGAISPAGDVDYIAVSGGAGSYFIATIGDLGDGACTGFLMDTELAVIDTDGTTVLESDDDGGVGHCSEAVSGVLEGGTYFLRVNAKSGTTPATFGYALNVVFQ
jgi:hypothetical protein